MPWFSYNYPGNPQSPNSYTLLDQEPACTGITLCSVNTDVVPGSIPARPDLTKAGVSQAISAALNGQITTGVTRLRPNP